MFTYIYVIKNNMYPNNVYKLEISRQNLNQLCKKYNKYYIDDITVVDFILVKDDFIASKMIYDKLGKYYIRDTKQFIKCDENEIIKKLVDIEKIINENIDYQQQVKCINNTILDFISASCIKKTNSKILLNELYNLYNKNNKLDYLEFIYIIKKNKKLILVEINNIYFIEDIQFVHTSINIFDQYVNKMLIDSIGKFTSINQIVLNYKKWHSFNYSFIKMCFKNKLRDNLIKSIEKKYGKLDNNKYSKKCKNGWTNIIIK